MSLLLLALVLGHGPQPVSGVFTPETRVAVTSQDTLAAPAIVGRDAIESLEFPPFEFDPPEVDEHEIGGVTVFHLYDPTLPLVDVQLRLSGGTSHFSRRELAVVSAFPFVLRSGGTRDLPQDSIDRRIDLLALQLSFGGGGGGTSIRLNSLTETLEPALELLREVLLEPGWDSEALEVWRGQASERIRRREDNPSRLALSEFNRLMYGDHPVGWVMEEEDLAPDRLSVAELRALHEVLICRDRLILGVSGDLPWERAEPLIRGFLEPWPECAGDLSLPPEPDIRRDSGVFILRKQIDQSTVIVAQPGGVRQEDSPEYFATQIANHLLGAGGFTSRIMSRVRTEEGLAYGASSVWTTPIRYEGLVGALTATSAETTLEATNLLLDILQDFKDSPPSSDEVQNAVEEITTGYVFAFESPPQIVARQILYRAQGLSDGWLSRYWEGLREVSSEGVAAVVTEHLDPARMTILLVGDPSRFSAGLEAFESVSELFPDGTHAPWVSLPVGPDGSPPSLR